MLMGKKWYSIFMWLVLPSVIFAVAYAYCRQSGVLDISTPENIFLLMVGSFIPVAVLNISDMNKPDAKTQAEERKKAQHNSQIPKEYYRTKPEKGDFILGEYQGKYICTSIRNTDSHYSIIGTSGTGKTSCYLLNNLILNEAIGALVLDVKDSELFRKSTKFGDENVLRFDPSIQSSEVCGFDPFYLLSGKSRCSDAEILKTMQLVGNSLISIPADIKEPFWKQNAKNMLLGFALHFYKNGKHNLIEIADEILSKPVKENVAYVIENSSPADIEYRYLIAFQDMADQTISGVFSELASHLTVFSNHQGIRYALGNGAYRKITPLDLENKKRVYITINQTELGTMAGVVKLILDVMLYGLQTRMQGREESEVEPVLFIVDELPQLLQNGPLSQLIQGLRVLRSSKVRMVLAYQTVESLESAYSHSQVIDLISNTNHLIVLNGGSSVSTLKLLCDLVGQFKEKQKSFQNSGKSKSTTVSFQNQDILEQGDINRLPLDNKCLILSPTGWMILQKSPYYKCKYIQPKAEEIRRYNKNIAELQNEPEVELTIEDTPQQFELWLEYRNKTKE